MKPYSKIFSSRDRLNPDWITHCAIFIGTLLAGFSPTSQADEDTTLADEINHRVMQPVTLIEAVSLQTDISNAIRDIGKEEGDAYTLALLNGTYFSDDVSLDIASLIDIELDQLISAEFSQYAIAPLNHTLSVVDEPDDLDILPVSAASSSAESSSHTIYWVLGGVVVAGGIAAAIVLSDSGASHHSNGTNNQITVTTTPFSLANDARIDVDSYSTVTEEGIVLLNNNNSDENSQFVYIFDSSLTQILTDNEINKTQYEEMILKVYSGITYVIALPKKSNSDTSNDYNDYFYVWKIDFSDETIDKNQINIPDGANVSISQGVNYALRDMDNPQYVWFDSPTFDNSGTRFYKLDLSNLNNLTLSFTVKGTPQSGEFENFISNDTLYACGDNDIYSCEAYDTKDADPSAPISPKTVFTLSNDSEHDMLPMPGCKDYVLLAEQPDDNSMVTYSLYSLDLKKDTKTLVHQENEMTMGVSTSIIETSDGALSESLLEFSVLYNDKGTEMMAYLDKHPDISLEQFLNSTEGESVKDEVVGDINLSKIDTDESSCAQPTYEQVYSLPFTGEQFMKSYLGSVDTFPGWIIRLTDSPGTLYKDSNNNLIAIGANNNGNDEPQNEWYYDEISGFF